MYILCYSGAILSCVVDAVFQFKFSHAAYLQISEFFSVKSEESDICPLQQ